MVRQVERRMAKVKYIWRIVENNDCFCKWARSDKIKYWFFKTRELAEAFVQPIVEKRHESYVHDTIEIVNNKYGDADQFDAAEKKWWRKRPPLNIYRTKRRTVYLVGEPDWDSRDRRGYCYGAIERVKVLCG